MKRRTRNPSVPTPVLVLGGVAGLAALVYWATRQTAAATAQQLVQSGAQALTQPLLASTPTLSYAGDRMGRVLTDAEAVAILGPDYSADLTRSASPSVARSATLAAAMRQAADPTLDPQTREVAARLVAQLQGSIS
jgi:hypothetical protein